LSTKSKGFTARQIRAGRRVAHRNFTGPPCTGCSIPFRSRAAYPKKMASFLRVRSGTQHNCYRRAAEPKALSILATNDRDRDRQFYPARGQLFISPRPLCVPIVNWLL